MSWLEESLSAWRAWIETYFLLLNRESWIGRSPHGGRGLKQDICVCTEDPLMVALRMEGVD